MYKLKKIGKVFTGKFVGTGPSSFKKRDLPGRGLTNVKKHWYRPMVTLRRVMTCCTECLTGLFSWGKAAEARP